jgi:hypothetical protein
MIIIVAFGVLVLVGAVLAALRKRSAEHQEQNHSLHIF